MRKNTILKYKMEYEFDVATCFFQRYFSMVFQYFDVKPCELLIFIQIYAMCLSETTLHSMFGFGLPLIVLVVEVSQKNFLKMFFPITITIVNRGCLSMLCRFCISFFLR